MVPYEKISDGLASLSELIRKYGVIAGMRYWFSSVYHRAQFDNEGRCIFDKQWDVCIILDACRADELEREEGEYPWLIDVERCPSIASSTWNWLPRTLERAPDDILQQTTYVCANPFSDEFCEEYHFDTLDEVWRYAWNDTKGTVLPRPVTDRAITHGRDGESERLLVHYMQPHVPFLKDGSKDISRNNFDLRAKSGIDDWDRVARGDLSKATAISWYRETLTQVLEEVDLLLSNVNAERAVVTADHGEAFGEWGIYGHPGKTDLPCLTEVPWVETTATDHETHVPDDYETNATKGIIEDRLQSLGYANETE